MLNYTARRRDVLTLAHELGHGVHSALAAPQGIFHQSTPLTLAETASVFGETIVFGRLLEQADTPSRAWRCSPRRIEGSIATVFRQMAMNRFEDLVHTARRERGRAVGRPLRRAVGRDPGGAVRRRRRDHRGLPHRGGPTSPTSSTPPATSTPTPTGSCWRCRSTGATSEDGRGVRAALPGAAGRRRLAQPRGARARSSASTSPTPASGTAGLDLVEQQLLEAEALAERVGSESPA